MRTLGLVALLVVPSLYLFERHGGPLLLAAYVALAIAAATAWETGAIQRPLGRLSEPRARWLAVASLALLAVAFATIFPIANSGRYGGGSDADEALDLATRALLRGHFPYYERTYLGNPITPMPGELVLAIPFVLLGSSALQGLFWLGVGFLLLRRAFAGRTGEALGFAWVVLLCSPAVGHQLVTGCDYIPNAIMVLAGMLLVTRDGDTATGVLGSVLLGLALSSRANFLLVLPPVVARSWMVLGRRRATLRLGITAGVATTATAPFLLYDPARFSPLHTVGKLSSIVGPLPRPEIVVPAIASLVALALSTRRWNDSTRAMLRNAAIVQAVLIGGAALATGLAGGDPIRVSAFGVFFQVFAVGAIAISA